MFKDDVIFPITISYGSMSSYMWDVDIVETDSGTENRNGKWAHTRANYNAVYGVRTTEDMVDLIKTWHVVRGALYGLNYVDPLDNNSTDTPSTPDAIGSNNSITNTDQNFGSGDGVETDFQITKTYTIYGETYTRNIYKPLSSTVLMAIDGIAEPEYTLGSTGVVTFDDLTFTITNINKAAQAVLTVSEATTLLTVGQSIYVSGVSGMTEINDARYTVTAKTGFTITLDVNSTGFTTYSSGGTAKTLPQTGEAVTGGYEFYVPVRFNQKSLSTRFDDYEAHSTDVELVEIRL